MGGGVVVGGIGKYIPQLPAPSNLYFHSFPAKQNKNNRLLDNRTWFIG